ncbi:TonB-dependent receptor [Novosphingobium sp. RD2P27]|uniref:TonB-dependent receptor n=1 Tax=Novosphingobium kalidii TaxID=3230299 RepID=A0ABV2D4S5_9SPHN
MRKYKLLLGLAPLAFATPAFADAAADAAAQNEPAGAAKMEVFTTGVAKGRDRLDSATSTSALRGEEIQKIGARNVAEVLRNIPGIRVEAGSGDVNNSFTIRGLPLASNGSKYLQLQEDGLPVLEYGDMFVGADMLLRPDLNLNAVEAIRGGSASTFASNSPGGIINFISKTGDVEGGAVQVSTGLDFDEKRLDFDYGSRISDTVRFHVGGFYRTGEGPREVGFNAYKGGQLKLNVTKEFNGGYIRFLGKYLDDRTPAYMPVPVRVTGTNSDPKYSNVANFDITKDTTLSPFVTNVLTLDGNNNILRDDIREGMHAVVKSFGFETQFDVAGWTITDRFRYSDISGQLTQFQHGRVGFAANLIPEVLPSGTLTYATGPNAGQRVDPLTINGNALLALATMRDQQINSFDNMTNDLRASRQWDIGAGVLTTTAGFYRSTQSVDTSWLFTQGLSDVRGNAQSALVNVTTGAGEALTEDGIRTYNPGFRRRYDVQFDINAPYGSLNYMIGKIAIGGSIRYDFAKAEGSVFGSELGGGRVGSIPFDLNQDGVISAPEQTTAVLPLSRPGLVDFDYKYVSYSAGVNYRLAEPLAVFARYSRGGRGAADRVLFTPIVNHVTGDLVSDEAGHDVVKQAEVGVKYRQDNFALNLTGFWANTRELNTQTVARPDGTLSLGVIARTYEAIGAEFEGSFQHGPFSITAGATYTDAEIAEDSLNAAIEANVPRHQPKFIFQATPQYETEMFTLGTNVVGTTGSFAQDSNLLKMPGYTIVNAFVQVRPVERVQLSLTASNLFDKTAFTEVAAGSIPANGITQARVLNGRTITTSLRFDF